MIYNVFEKDVTKEIWEKADNTFLVFVGATCDAALDFEVMDWVYYKGGIINDPFKRLVSTITYARSFLGMSEEEGRQNALALRKFHNKMESERSSRSSQKKQISNEAFLRVLSGIIDYGIRGFEFLNRRKMTTEEKERFFQKNATLGQGMQIENIPKSFEEWEKYRKKTFVDEFGKNDFTENFYVRLREIFGPVGFWALTNFQALFVDRQISKKLGLKKPGIFFRFLFFVYPFLRSDFALRVAIFLIVPAEGRKILEQSLVRGQNNLGEGEENA